MKNNLVIHDNLIGHKGYDRVKILTDIKSLNTELMGSYKYNIGYAALDDDKCNEIIDTSTGEYLRIKNLKLMVTTEAADDDNIRYGISVSDQRAILDITMPRVAYNTIHNIYNVHTEAAARGVIQTVKTELMALGVELVDEDLWEVIYIEGNITNKTEYPLINYKSILDWVEEEIFKSKAFRDDGRNRRHNNNSISLTYAFKTDRRGITIYDKARHLEDTLNICVSDNLVRCEAKWRKKGILKAFGSNDITILYDMEALNQAYDRAINTILRVVANATREQMAFIYTKLKAPGVRRMRDVWDKEGDDIFDPILLLAAAEKIYKENNRKEFSRDKKIFLKHIGDKKIYKYRDLIYILSCFGGDINLLNLDRLKLN